MSLSWDCSNGILLLWTCLSFLPCSNEDGKGGISLSLAELATVMTPLSFELPASPSICFLENDFSVSILSVSGSITLRNHADPIIFVSYMSILYWKWHLRSDSNPTSSAPTSCIGGIEMVFMEHPWHSGFKLVYEKGRFFILCSCHPPLEAAILGADQHPKRLLFSQFVFVYQTVLDIILLAISPEVRLCLLDLKCYCVLSETVIFIKSYLSIRSRAEQDGKRLLWC